MAYNDFGDPNIRKAIESTLKIFKTLDKPMYENVSNWIEGFTKKEDLIHFLINPINFYGTQLKEPKGVTLNKVCDDERIIISEHIFLPFKGKVVIDGVTYPVKSAKRLTIFPTYVRKNQQISNKEAKSASSDNSTDILGQSAGGDKVGTFSDSEWTTCLQHNLFNIVKELNGPASHDVEQKKVFRTEMMTTGETSLETMPENMANKRSLLYLDQMLKMMGIDSDLIQYPE